MEDITAQALAAGIDCVSAQTDSEGCFTIGDPDTDPDACVISLFCNDLTLIRLVRSDGFCIEAPVPNALIEDLGLEGALREVQVLARLAEFARCEDEVPAAVAADVDIDLDIEIEGP